MMKNEKVVVMAKEIEDKLKELLRMKVEVGYSVSSTSDVFIVDVYQSDYDYYRVKFNYHEEVNAGNYAYMTIDLVGKKMVNKDIEGHVSFCKASPIEKFVMELIKDYKVEDFLHVVGTELYGDFENQFVSLHDIVNFNFNPVTGVLILQEDQGEQWIYTIDFVNKTIAEKVEEMEIA